LVAFESRIKASACRLNVTGRVIAAIHRIGTFIDGPQVSVTLPGRKENTFMKTTILPYLSALCAVLSSCGGNPNRMSVANVSPTPASVSVHTEVTKDYEYAGTPMKKILIIGVFADPVVERLVEDGFAVQLNSLGVDTSSAYKVLPTDTELTRELIASRIADTNIDGVIIAEVGNTSTVQTETLRTNAPSDGGGMAGRISGSGSDMYGYYSGVYQTSREPGYAVQSLRYEIKVSLFEVKYGKSVWQASQTVDNPDTRNEMIERLAKLTAESLSNEGIIEKNPGAPSRVAP
jgi:ABC-type transport system substrate-binding protein